ncbi:MAG: threonylcarbamoyl-AMP synthase [Oscillospiraceae bacterium]|nr:threonylcarbamoyl-AMP synthase [Oscillospiraceae bacterium]
MNTKVLTQSDTEEAARILREGGLVGIPTETVYGLGANALDDTAVANIFIAKGRPQDNPLIIHIPEAAWLEQYCTDVPDTAWRLAERFWPGPMTMVLPRSALVSDRVTAGLDTVGIRCPGHELCREIIRLAGVPVAAPSGNTSGRPSPTTAAHMLEDMDGKIDAIVDGGPCGVGVESTIIDLTCTPPRLLRPGGITLEQLTEVLGEVEVDPAVRRQMRAGEKPKAPGMAYRHYAPRAPVTVVTGDAKATAGYILSHAKGGDGVICFDEYSDQFPGCHVIAVGKFADKQEQARHIFDALRAFDHTEVLAIWAQCPDSSGIGLAVVNRLSKAAGFHVIEVEP